MIFPFQSFADFSLVNERSFGWVIFKGIIQGITHSSAYECYYSGCRSQALLVNLQVPGV
jgi:hypothetical protein